MRPKSGDIYMSDIMNFHLFINPDQYVHIVTGSNKAEKSFGVDDNVQLTKYCTHFATWKFLFNIGELLCNATEQSCKPTKTILNILQSERYD